MSSLLVSSLSLMVLGPIPPFNVPEFPSVEACSYSGISSSLHPGCVPVSWNISLRSHCPCNDFQVPPKFYEQLVLPLFSALCKCIPWSECMDSIYGNNIFIILIQCILFLRFRCSSIFVWTYLSKFCDIVIFYATDIGCINQQHLSWACMERMACKKGFCFPTLGVKATQ